MRSRLFGKDENLCNKAIVVLSVGLLCCSRPGFGSGRARAQLLSQCILVPIGGSSTSAKHDKYFKVYVPTAYGGTLTITPSLGEIWEIDGPNGEVFKNGTQTGVGNNGYYTFKVRHTLKQSYTVSATFKQYGEAAYRPWNFYWYSYYPTTNGNLYAVSNSPVTPMLHYDQVYGTNSQSWEQQNHFTSNPGLGWEGHCFGGALASISFYEPSPKTIVSQEELKGLYAEVGETIGSPPVGTATDEIPPGPPSPNGGPTDYYASEVQGEFERFLVAHQGGFNNPLHCNLRAATPTVSFVDAQGNRQTISTVRQVWNHAVYRYQTLSYVQAANAPQVVQMIVQIDANLDAAPPTGPLSPNSPSRTITYTYDIAYQPNGEVELGNSHWLSVGGDAAWAPQFFNAISQIYWAVQSTVPPLRNPNISLTNIVALDAKGWR